MGDMMDWLKKETRIKNVLYVVLLGIALYYLFSLWHVFDFIQILLKALIPILIGIFISFLFEPLIVRLIRLKISRNVACLIVYASIFIVFASALLLLIPKLLGQLQGFMEYLPNITTFFNQFQKSELNQTIASFHLDEQMTSLIKDGCQSVFERCSHLLDGFFQFGIGAGAALYLSFDFKKVTSYYYDLAPRAYRKEFRIISKRIGNATFLFLRSMLYDTIIFFILSAILLYLFCFDYPLVFAAILALTNLIPYIGPYIGLIPLAIAGFMVSQSQGLIGIGIAFSMQSIESTFISPILLNNMIYLHPVVGIFGMSFFGSLFGVLGMIFSPLLMIVFKILYEEIVFKQIWLEKEKK